MGEEVAAKEFTREDRQRYRSKVKRCLDVFDRMLREARFDPEKRSFGLALELIADADFQTELAQFNIEINVAPRLLQDGVLTELEGAVRHSLNRAEERSREAG